MMVSIGRGDYVRADLILSVGVELRNISSTECFLVVRWEGGEVRHFFNSYVDAAVLASRVAGDVNVAMQSVGNYRRPW